MDDALLARIAAWCARAEHASSEVTTRLLRWGVDPDDVPDYLARLTADGYVNDQRYAESFVMDKWRFHGWGRVRIARALAEKGIEEGSIDRAIGRIPEEEYDRFRENLMRQKADGLPFAPPDAQAANLMRFAVNRGLEEEWIHDWLDRNGYLENGDPFMES